MSIKSRIVLVSVALVSSNLQAQDGIGDYFSASYNAEVFGSYYAVREDSPLNPANQLGQIQDRDLNQVIRSDASAEFGNLVFSASPRLQYFVHDINGESVNDDDIYFQEWSMSYAFNRLNFSYSREVLFWGPSLFSSPSNPFYGSTDQSNPFIEIDAREFVQMGGYIGDRFTAAMIVNTDEGREESEVMDFTKSIGFKMDYSGDSFHSGAIVSHREDDVTQLGVFGQWVATDALLFYADVGVKDRSTAIYAVEDSAASIGFDFESRQDEKEAVGDAVLGVSFTGNDGATWGLEYRHNSEGYSDEESEAYYSLADVASSEIQNNGINSGTANQLLFIAADTGLRTLRKNYLYAQYFKRDVIPDLSLNFRLSHNLDDGSSQLALVSNYYLNDNLAFAANMIFNLGNGSSSEFQQYVDRAGFVGFKYFF